MAKLDNGFANTQKPLPPLLDEFRTALQDEIEVAKRNASNSTIPLSNGHKVGQQGSAFQYAFLIDSVLNTPDGTPGDLVVPGKAPIKATIVSAEGLRLVISIETDLGKFVPTARLQTNLTFLMRKLIERIENNASVSNPAASRMLGASPVSGSPKKPETIPLLNESQILALESALGRNLTVIWGPPGTGKTHTIGTITQFLHASARTVLIVSHTNTAVDQAIKHVAKAMPEHLEQGAVIRVGEVRDDELNSGFPDVLLKRQVERQSRELVELRDNLVSQKQALGDELNAVQQKISIIEWVEAAKIDIQSSESRFEELHRLEEQLRLAERTLSELENKHSQLLELHDRTSRILALRKKLAVQFAEKCRLERLLTENAKAWHDVNRRIQEQEKRIEILHRITPLRQEQAKYPSLNEQKSIIATLSGRMVEARDSLRQAQQNYDEANAILQESRSTGAVLRLWKRLPKPEIQQAVVTDLSKKVAALNSELLAAQTACEAARHRLSRIMELDGELSQYQDIGDHSKELVRQRAAQEALEDLKRKKPEIESDLKKTVREIEELQSDEKQQAATVDGDAKVVYLTVCSQLRDLKELRDSIKSLRSRTRELRESITSLISRLLSQLLEWGILSPLPSSAAEETLHSLRMTHQTLAAQHKPSDLPALKDRAGSLRFEMERLTGEIANIDAHLAQVERDVITKASIVGATLTKAYLSDDIQARRFDTVILDEASMAPIPALWVAALLSENNLIIVGDFKQLPPIVLSTKELTKKWLGHDIFEASGLKTLWEKHTPPDHFIPLDEQRRMLREIAEVANLFYDGMLRTPPELPERHNEFTEWYNADWPYDNPVVLVDTGSLNAWVTSVVKSGNSSRLNFLSATVAVDLAEQLQLPQRPKRAEGAPKRILIIAPYRAHAKLVSLLLNQNGQLQDEVIAGTVHSFQGSQADAVIFDLVVDEPHFRVNLFMPSLDEQLKCLLNVGLTRAKFRLFILGDFSYCESKGRRAFLGKTLLPFLLKSFPRIDASQLFPNGLAARAAKAQMTMLGGEIEPDSERIVVTQADFFRTISADFSRAKSRVIIYSPFMTQDRLAFLMPQLQAASFRGVAVFIITKSHSERSQSELAHIRRMEKQLSEIGVVVVHKMRMHEKLVFIDDDITWSGSLNPLSFSNTQEVMERRKSKAVLGDYFQILRLTELIAVHGNEESKCPICGSEMVAAEGADQPYYWRCINDGCYSRGIDQPYPFDGVLTCGACNCNAPVEFGYWGDYPHWRCTANNRHHQKIFKTHLRLPKMSALIPKRERRKVYKILGIDDLSVHVVSSERAVSSTSKQISLFDEFE